MSKEINSNTPKNLDNYRGQYVIFFSEEDNPEVIFNSIVPEEAYQKAKEIEQEQGRNPVVIRVHESDTDSVSQVLARF